MGGFEKTFGIKPENGLAPAHVADAIENIVNVRNHKMGDVMKVANSITTMWKQVNWLHPSWITNNVLSNLFLAFAGDGQGGTVRAVDMLKHAKDMTMAEWYRNSPEQLKNIKFTVGGRDISAEQLLHDLAINRVDETSFHSADLLTQSKVGYSAIPGAPVPGASRGPLESAAAIPGDFVERAKRFAIARGATSPSVADQVRAAGNVMSDRAVKGLAAPFMAANTKAENITRGLGYLSYLEQGYEPAEAAAAATRTFYNYAAQTPTEKNLKVLVPFYGWMKNNLVGQVRNLLANPSNANLYPKLKNAVEEAFVGDQRVPDYHRPEWLRDAMGVQLSGDPETRKFLTLASTMPQEAIPSLAQGVLGEQGFQNFVHYFAGSTNPLLQAPFVIGGGHDIFSGKSVGPFGDESILDWVLGQSRHLREGGLAGNRSPQGRAFDEGVVPGVGRLLLGGRLTSAGDQKLAASLASEFRDKEEGIKKAIRHAENSGNDRGSFELRTDLMRLYKSMEKAGLGDHVPKWAREQLAS